MKMSFRNCKFQSKIFGGGEVHYSVNSRRRLLRRSDRSSYKRMIRTILLSFLFLVLLFLPSVFGVIPPSMGMIPASKTQNITFVLGQPVTGSFWPAGVTGLHFAEWMTQRINENPNILPNHYLNVVQVDYACSERVASRTFFDTILGNSPFAFYNDVAELSERIFVNKINASNTTSNWHLGLTEGAVMQSDFISWGIGNYISKETHYPNGIQAIFLDCSTTLGALHPFISEPVMKIPHIALYSARTVFRDRATYGSLHSVYSTVSWDMVLRAFPSLLTAVQVQNDHGIPKMQKVKYTHVIDAPDQVQNAKYFSTAILPVKNRIPGWTENFEVVGFDISLSLEVSQNREYAKGHLIYQTVANGRTTEEQAEDAALAIKKGYSTSNTGSGGSSSSTIEINRTSKGGIHPRVLIIWGWQLTTVGYMLCSLYKLGVRDVYFTTTSWLGTGFLSGEGTKCTSQEIQSIAAFSLQSAPVWGPEKPESSTSSSSALKLTCAPEWTSYDFVYEGYRYMVPSKPEFQNLPDDPRLASTDKEIARFARPKQLYNRYTDLDDIKAMTLSSYTQDTPFGYKLYLDSTVAANAVCFMALAFDNMLENRSGHGNYTIPQLTTPQLRFGTELPSSGTGSVDDWPSRFREIMSLVPSGVNGEGIIGTAGHAKFPDITSSTGSTIKDFGVSFSVLMLQYHALFLVHNQPEFRLGPFVNTAEAAKVLSVSFYTETHSKMGCLGKKTYEATNVGLTVGTAGSMISAEGTSGIGVFLTRPLSTLGDVLTLENLAWCIHIELRGDLVGVSGDTHDRIELHSRNPDRSGKRYTDWIPVITGTSNTPTSPHLDFTTPSTLASNVGGKATFIELVTRPIPVTKTIEGKPPQYPASQPIRAHARAEEGAIGTIRYNPDSSNSTMSNGSSTLIPMSTLERKNGFPECPNLPICYNPNAGEVGKCIMDWGTGSCKGNPKGQQFFEGLLQCDVGSSAAHLNLPLNEVNPATDCKPCPLNHFKSAIGSNSQCNVCADGSYTSRIGSTACTLCPLGKYLNWSTKSAQDRETNADPCDTCPGFLEGLTTTWSRGATSINECIPQSGYYNLNPELVLTADLILPCPTGLVCDWRSFEQAKENLGRTEGGYMILSRDLQKGVKRKTYRCQSQDTCPPMTLTSRTEDSCASDEYAYGVGCSLCRHGHVINKDTLNIENGGSGMSTITSLTGGINLKRYGGGPQRYYYESHCVECPSGFGQAWIGISVILGVLFFIMGIYWFMCPSHDVLCAEQIHTRVLGLKITTSLGLVIGNFGTFSVVRQMGFVFPPLLRDGVVNIVSEVFGFMEISSSFLCMFGDTDNAYKHDGTNEKVGIDFVALVAMRNIVPLICLTIVGCVLSTFHFHPRLRKLPVHSKPSIVDCCAAIIGIFETLFVSIVSNAINAGFNRIEHPSEKENPVVTTFHSESGNPITIQNPITTLSSETSSLRAQPSVFSDSSEATSVIIICIFGLLFWCLGFIVMITILLYTANGGMSKSRFHSMIMLCFLARFTDQTYWGSIVLLLRRLLIGIAPSLSNVGFPNPRTRLWFVQFVMILAVTFNAVRKPYRFKIFEYVDSGSMTMMIILFSASLADDMLENFCLVIFCLTLFFILMLVGREAWRYRVIRTRTLQKSRSTVNLSHAKAEMRKIINLNEFQSQQNLLSSASNAASSVAFKPNWATEGAHNAQLRKWNNSDNVGTTNDDIKHRKNDFSHTRRSKKADTSFFSDRIVPVHTISTTSGLSEKPPDIISAGPVTTGKPPTNSNLVMNKLLEKDLASRILGKMRVMKMVESDSIKGLVDSSPNKTIHISSSNPNSSTATRKHKSSCFRGGEVASSGSEIASNMEVDSSQSSTNRLEVSSVCSRLLDHQVDDTSSVSSTVGVSWDGISWDIVSDPSRVSRDVIVFLEVQEEEEEGNILVGNIPNNADDDLEEGTHQVQRSQTSKSSGSESTPERPNLGVPKMTSGVKSHHGTNVSSYSKSGSIDMRRSQKSNSAKLLDDMSYLGSSAKIMPVNTFRDRHEDTQATLEIFSASTENNNRIRMQPRQTPEALDFLIGYLERDQLLLEQEQRDLEKSDSALWEEMGEMSARGETGPETRKCMSFLLKPSRHADDILAYLSDAEVDVLHNISDTVRMKKNRVHLSHILGHAFNEELHRSYDPEAAKRSSSHVISGGGLANELGMAGEYNIMEYNHGKDGQVSTSPKDGFIGHGIGQGQGQGIIVPIQGQGGQASAPASGSNVTPMNSGGPSATRVPKMHRKSSLVVPESLGRAITSANSRKSDKPKTPLQ